MNNITFYHNPRCSKSREALELIREKKGEPTIVEYIKEPLNAEDLQNLLSLLNMQAMDLIRKKETLYKEINPQTQEEALNAMIQHPKLIERPIVVSGKKAVIGRPKEAVLTLFK
ncbi:arsenate reductase (glutaredoxin) [Patescibacteria group bacterium]|nr:arsenate reductase (glutaredoxin) [Patescibacteria group bacterium]MBU1721242.1 arsenate reductase (glutaredoxin) [Patescibacteria group bacterium]MBU1901050.1 arsenate reductase (glutaredoxin) [Patescibacteria group bacterium]